MTLNSMTGFARVEGQNEWCSWAWELKSVNAKGLDIRCRSAAGFDRLEPKVRELVATRFRRGSVNVGLSVTWAATSKSFQVNDAILAVIADLLPTIQERFPEAAPPTVDGVMAVKGLIEPVDEGMPDDVRDQLDEAVLASLETALDQLRAMRADEGARLQPVIEGHIGRIEELTSRADETTSVQTDAIRGRLRDKVQALMEIEPALPEDRLAQEAALLMTAADVREELDRLSAHEKAARKLISGEGAVGRKLDFLCQEFNREANTLCSKATEVELTEIGIELKAAVEQLREQIQNIE